MYVQAPDRKAITVPALRRMKAEGRKIVMLTTRQDRHPIHTTPGALETSAGRQKTKLHRVNTDIARLTRRDVAMLLSREFNQPIPDRHVLNRIRLIRYCTQIG